MKNKIEQFASVERDFPGLLIQAQKYLLFRVDVSDVAPESLTKGQLAFSPARLPHLPPALVSKTLPRLLGSESPKYSVSFLFHPTARSLLWVCPAPPGLPSLGGSGGRCCPASVRDGGCVCGCRAGRNDWAPTGPRRRSVHSLSHFRASSAPRRVPVLFLTFSDSWA